MKAPLSSGSPGEAGEEVEETGRTTGRMAGMSLRTTGAASGGKRQNNFKPSTLLVLLYVYDILILGSSVDLISSFISDFTHHFDACDLGPATSFLGVRIIRDRPHHPRSSATSSSVRRQPLILV